MSSQSKSHPNEPIALIGSGFRFPGGANTPSKLWDLLREPRDVQSVIPEDRFDPNGFFHPANDHHGTSNTRHSYFLLEDCRQFDAHFFGIKPVEADAMDPQQRMLLEAVYESVEAAGLSMDALRGSPTAVYVGVMGADWADMMNRDPSYLPTYTATGTARSMIANRVSYFFDWRSPSMTIDTACSSSLVAVHQAVQSLRTGESKVAVAAGVNLLLGPEPYISESKLKMLSPDGRSYMWDARANGYARGEGIAAIVLKTLSAAIADGDDIECLIVETALNQDGKTKGITVPSATAQAALINTTYRKAGLDLTKARDRPQYFEAHGTGTPAGDPKEAEAIDTAFFRNNTPSHVIDPLYVGSIKTVIGHTEGTAGLAGLLKVSLALKHGFIPPNCLFENLAPAVKPFYNNLEIATTAKPWPALEQGCSRRASVNSFGFGGTNAHCILESYTFDQCEVGQICPMYTPFVFSAASDKALSAVVASYSEYIDSNPQVNLRALSHTLYSRRNAFPHRVAFSARDVTGLRAKLDMFAVGVGETPTIAVPTTASPLRILGIFTGQGAQWAGMASKLLESPAAAKIINHLEQSLSELKDYPPQWSLSAELLADQYSSRVMEAALSQPACTAVQILLVDLLRAAGLSFSAVVGHSSGEIGAAYAAGFLSARDAIRIAYYRGVHLESAQGKNGEVGAMIAVGTSYEDAQRICNLDEFRGKVCVAASNSASSITISGDAAAVEGIRAIFQSAEKLARVLKVNKAYHSHHMLACSEAYIASLRACNIKARQPTPPNCLWVSSVYQQDVAKVTDDLSNCYWSSNLVSPVLFSQALEYALENSKFDLAVELGPHPALKGPACQVIERALGHVIPYTGTLSRNTDDFESLANGLSYIWASFNDSGVDLARYDHFFNTSEPPKMLKDLPTYPWEHQRTFWHESRISKAYRGRRMNHELLGVRNPNFSEDQISWTNHLIPRELPWLPGHRIQGQIIFPCAGYISSAFEAAREISANRPMKLIELTNFSIGQPVMFDSEDSNVESLISLTDIRHESFSMSAKFSYYSTAIGGPTPMSLNARGELHVIFGEEDADLLQPIPQPQFGMMEVDHERIYQSFASYGYDYTGAFKALTSVERKLGFASGLIHVPENVPGKRLLIHPAALDAAIHSILVAHSYPGDGQLASIPLPTDVSRISINPVQALAGVCTETLRFVSSVSQDDGKRVGGDVDLYPADGSHAMLQLEGLQTIPMVPATVATDAHVFSETIWGPASPDVTIVTAEVQADHGFGFVLERVAHYYLRNLGSGTTVQDRADCEWYHESFLQFADTMVSRVADGTHPFGKKEWINDTYRDIVAIIENHPQSIDLRLMQAVGKSIISVVQDQTTILESMMKDNMLGEFYVTGLGMEEYLRKLAATVGQIGHRYPAISVLEIGAGTGGATKFILDELEEAFASYTYTDISAGFFDAAKEGFQSHETKMIYKTLDIERDIISQGYAEHSFDVIVASLVLHATSSLGETIANVRRLLKPGGYLLLLEITDYDSMRFGFLFGGLQGWWLGHEDGRTLSPCVDISGWNKLLKEHGFAGVDSMAVPRTSEPLPLCVMLAQAVDDRVNFLRNPLVSMQEGFRLPEITFVGGTTAATSRCFSTITDILHACGDRVTQAKSLVDHASVDFPFGGTVVSLQDNDKPVFEYLDEDTLRGMQKLFERSRNVLWITCGYKRGSPYAKMVVAFVRCLLHEMPHVRLQFLDIPSSEVLHATRISECLLRFLVTGDWEEQGLLDGILWSLEPELSFEDGHNFVPRLKLSKTLNNRYNSARRQIVEVVKSSVVPVTLSYKSGAYILTSKSGFTPETPAGSADYINIHVSYSLLKAVKIESHGFFYLLMGIDHATSRQVVALSSSLSSEVNVPKCLTRPCFLSGEEAVPFLVALYYNLTSCTALRHLDRGDSLLVLEPEKSLATCIESLAAVKGINATIFTAEGTSNSPGAGRSIQSHALRRNIDTMLPHQLSRVLCWQHADWVSAMRKYLPERTTIETYESYVAMKASNVSSNAISRVSDLLGRVMEQYLSVTSTFDVGAIQTLSLSDVHNLHHSGSSPTVLDWAPSSTVPMTLEPVDRRCLFRSDRTYWLVGLTGGLGLSLCQWMISRGAKNIALSSRNPQIDPQWHIHFESLKATVKVYANDVTDRESVMSVYRKIQTDMPPVAGVCHGAMVLQDTLFLDLDMSRMEKVLKPKVKGAIHLDKVFQCQNLDFFIMLSSIAAVVGNPGQAAYAAANMFLSGVAAQRRARGVAASTVHLGAVIGNGYVTRELALTQQLALQKAGTTYMSEQDFHQIFAEAVVASQPSSGSNSEYCTGLCVHYADDDDDKPKFAENPVFSHLTLHRSVSESLTTGHTTVTSIKTQLLRATTIEGVYNIMEVSLVLKLRKALQLSPDADVLGQTADSLGIDSLVAVDLRSWFMKELSIDMPVLKIIGGSTMSELLEKAQELLSPSIIPAIGNGLTPAKVDALEQVEATKADTPALRPLSKSELPEMDSNFVVAAPHIEITSNSVPTSNALEPESPEITHTTPAPAGPNPIVPNPTIEYPEHKPAPTFTAQQLIPVLQSQDLTVTIQTALPAPREEQAPTPKTVTTPKTGLLTSITNNEANSHVPSPVAVPSSQVEVKNGISSVHSLSSASPESDKPVSRRKKFYRVFGSKRLKRLLRHW